MNTTETPTGEHSFATLGIEPRILETITKSGITTPTPIQNQAIPVAIHGGDVIGIAQTGTGKTLAFGVPMIQQLIGKDERGLILLPTRELALQVEETITRIGRSVGISAAILIGGANMRQQVAAIRRNPNIIIATPGRLIDHLQQGTIRLDKVAILVFDEADRMLDMGFQPQIRKVLETVPKERQTMLFSATLSSDIAQIANKHMKTPISIEVAPQGTTAEKVTQEFFIVTRDQKVPLLESVLQKYTGSTLVFTRTKHGAKKILDAVKAMGHKAAEIHGNRSLSQRREALDGFKNGRYRVLVATDIASRGIDVKGLELVINFDLPMDSSDYVHRIGRTGRAGAEGHAISFAMPSERGGMRDIERLIRKSVPVTPLPDSIPGPRASVAPFSAQGDNRAQSPRPYRSGGNYRGGASQGGYSRGGLSSRGHSRSGSSYGGQSRGGSSFGSRSRTGSSYGAPRSESSGSESARPVHSSNQPFPPRSHSVDGFQIRTGTRPSTGGRPSFGSGRGPRPATFHRTPRHKRSAR